MLKSAGPSLLADPPSLEAPPAASSAARTRSCASTFFNTCYITTPLNVKTLNRERLVERVASDERVASSRGTGRPCASDSKGARKGATSSAHGTAALRVNEATFRVRKTPFRPPPDSLQ
eukprot:1193286-Prorocentrum_minimum.AAC.1